MQEIPFSIPVSGIIKIDGSKVTIIVQQVETNITINAPSSALGRFRHESGKTIYDIVLETAQKLVLAGETSLTAAQLYGEALEDYPNLKRNSWTSHVIASTPNHPSYKHHSSRRDFFSYSGNGKYRLNQEHWLEND